MLQLLGHYSQIPCDSETVRHLHKWHKLSTCTLANVQQHAQQAMLRLHARCLVLTEVSCLQTYSCCPRKHAELLPCIFCQSYVLLLLLFVCSQILCCLTWSLLHIRCMPNMHRTNFLPFGMNCGVIMSPWLALLRHWTRNAILFSQVPLLAPSCLPIDAAPCCCPFLLPLHACLLVLPLAC